MTIEKQIMDYVESCGTFLSHTEIEAATALIDSHKRLRKDQQDRAATFRKLPRWKLFILRLLKIDIS